MSPIFSQINSDYVDIFSLRQANSIIPSYPNFCKLTESVVITFITPSDNGYEIYVQDISGGISLLIPPTLPLIYQIGDRLVNVEGIVTLYKGRFSLITQSPPFIVTNDNVIFPNLIDVETMMLNPLIYDGNLVQLNEVTINGGGLMFEVGRNYILYGQNGTTALATLFPYCNYLGSPIPTAYFNLIGIVNWNRLTNEVTITPRSLSDIQIKEKETMDNAYTIGNVSIHNGYIDIQAIATETLEIYTLLGQRIIYETIQPGNRQIKIPRSGIYILRLGNLVERIVVP